MDIQRQHLKSVVFLCIEQTDDDGKAYNQPVSTGFVVNFPDPLHNCSWNYLVTARHCIEEVPGSQIVVRVNTTDVYRDFATDQGDWFTHDSADVATLLFTPPTDAMFEAIPFSVLIRNYTVAAPPEVPKDSIIRQHAEMGAFKVRIGHEVFFTGLFAESAGKQRNLPIVRFGHIARMPEERITFKTRARGEIDLAVYLAECRSWGGHSGSPAYWYNEVKSSDLIRADGKEYTAVVGQYYMIGLLGLVTGHFAIPEKGRSDDAGIEIETRLNAGIAMITPADEIAALLMRDDLQEDRQDRIKQ